MLSNSNRLNKEYRKNQETGHKQTVVKSRKQHKQENSMQTYCLYDIGKTEWRKNEITNPSAVLAVANAKCKSFFVDAFVFFLSFFLSSSQLVEVKNVTRELWYKYYFFALFTKGLHRQLPK